MLKNRSVPADILLPHVIYQDVRQAIAWLTRVFGFRENYRYGNTGGTVDGAQMCLGNAYIMVRGTHRDGSTPAKIGTYTQSLTVFVEDVDAHFRRAKSEGAKIVEELHETCYGERQYGVEDLDGHHWLFSQHAKDVNPADWGATITNPVLKTMA
ncbi:MAG TPA: VOC family protein [Candidatus Acidoferrum sp.]|nr:VOC family protein [Candidatus Acidoferrum sp.]